MMNLDRQVENLKWRMARNQGPATQIVFGQGHTEEIAIARAIDAAGRKVTVLRTEFVKQPRRRCDPYVVRLLVAAVEQEEKFRIDVSPDHREAHLSITPASRTVSALSITMADIDEALRRAGVLHGIDRQAVEQAIDEVRAGMPVSRRLVARATAPDDGQDGGVKFNVRPNSMPGRFDPGTGQMDFREHSDYSRVPAGTILAVLGSATRGTPGMDIRGRPISPKTGRMPTLIPGRHVVLEESQQTGHRHFRATHPGQVFLEDDTLSVHEMTVIPGNVDYSTGNIRTSGLVLVRGGIMPGFTVEVDGALIVCGTVEGATVIVRGAASFQSGIKGHGKTMIHAEGTVKARYVEKAVLFTGGNLLVEKGIVDSHVVCGGSIKVVSPKGAVVGGRIRAEGDIEVPHAGSEAGIGTILVGGVDYRTERDLLETEVAAVDAKRRLAHIEELLAKKVADVRLDPHETDGSPRLRTMNPEDETRLTDEKETLSQRIAELTARKTLLLRTGIARTRRRSKITIKTRVCPNVLLQIGEEKQLNQQARHGYLFRVLDETPSASGREKAA